MDRRDIERKLAAADSRRGAAEERLHQNAARLEELEDERLALLGSSELAQRAVADYEQHLARLRADLAAVEVEEARQRLNDTVAARDAAIAACAAAAGEMAASWDRIAIARADLVAAHRELQAIDPDGRSIIPPEPDGFQEEWRRAAAMVEAELNVRLESEIVEAAARSIDTRVINDLPEHLRELVRKRRRDLQRVALARNAGQAD